MTDEQLSDFVWRGTRAIGAGLLSFALALLNFPLFVLWLVALILGVIPGFGQVALPLMTRGGSLVTLTYEGATRVMPSYNVMGVAKAALEASVRYLAADLGPQGIRVNAVSAGPMRTLAGAVIGGARYVYRVSREASPLRRNVELTDVGGAALYLLSDLSTGVSGEIHFVDSGYNVIAMPLPDALRADAGAKNGD